jgi:hypothetical protein
MPSPAFGDEGFTFAELLVALSLLLISLIAVAGLASTSSLMTASARERAAMVNAAASYLERARQVPYANVGTPSGDPSGTLLPYVAVSGSYTVTITPVVTWGLVDAPTVPPNHDLKTVTLYVSASRTGGGSPMTYTTAAVFADVGTVGGALPGGAGGPLAFVTGAFEALRVPSHDPALRVRAGIG